MAPASSAVPMKISFIRTFGDELPGEPEYFTEAVALDMSRRKLPGDHAVRLLTSAAAGRRQFVRGVKYPGWQCPPPASGARFTESSRSYRESCEARRQAI